MNANGVELPAVDSDYLVKQELEDKRLDLLNMGNDLPPIRWPNTTGTALAIPLKPL